MLKGHNTGKLFAGRVSPLGTMQGSISKRAVRHLGYLGCQKNLGHSWDLFLIGLKQLLGHGD